MERKLPSKRPFLRFYARVSLRDFSLFFTQKRESVKKGKEKISISHKDAKPQRKVITDWKDIVFFPSVFFASSRLCVRLNRLSNIRLFCLFAVVFCVPQYAGAAPPDVPLILPNGLRLILRERREKPLVALDMWVRAGSRDEKSGEEGCAHFLEHTLFKGTATRKSNELDFAMESLGGIFTAATGPDYAHFGATIPAASLEPALGLLSELIRNADLPDAEIQRERGPIQEELALRGADAQAQTLESAYALAFTTHPYRRSPGGTPAAIRARTRDELLAFYKQNYTPERAALVLTGDFDSEAAKTLITKTFGDWKRGEASAETKDAPNREPDLTEPRVSNALSSEQEGKIVIAFRVPPASDSGNARALLLIDALLGSSENGGLLAVPALAGTKAEARYTPRLDGSLFSITADIPPSANPAAIEAAIETVLRRLQTSPPTPAALQSARQQILARTRNDGETLAGLARSLGYAALVHADSPETLSRVLPLVKAQDIPKTALRYFDWNRRVEIRFLPAPTSAPTATKENEAK